jgi:hypothetical protein
VVVVEVAGRDDDLVEDLDLANQLALTEGSRGVVCDLSAVVEVAGLPTVGGARSAVVELLASAGRHSRDWPGMPVAVACPDPQVRESLHTFPLGVHLIVTDSLFAAVTAVLATPKVTAVGLSLAPHPTSPRAAREFVTRTLLDWRLGRVIPFAALVVSELVASSSVHAGTKIDLSVSWDLQALRLSVRDHGPSLPRDVHTYPDLHGRALTVVAGLSRTFGILPAADGGKVAWAVLEAPRPRASIRTSRSDTGDRMQNPPIFTDGRGMVEMPFCAGSNRPPP